MRSHGIMFHYFENRDKHRKCQGSVTADELCRMIEYLRHGYHLLDAQDYLECALQNKLKEDYVCLTFDDGVKSQIDVAWDVLKSKKVTGFFFSYSSHFDTSPSMLEVYHDFRFRKYDNIDGFYSDFMDRMLAVAASLHSDVRSAMASFDPKKYLVHSKCHTDNDRLFRYVRDCVLSREEYDGIMMHLMAQKGYDMNRYIPELWMNENDLKCLHAHGNVVGMHSHTHPTTMAVKSWHEQYTEYRKNQETLQRILGADVIAASYPSGAFNQDTNGIMEQLQVRIAFQANMAPNGNSLYQMPRKNHTDLIDEMKENMWIK